jgi:hypothetical protein
MATGFARYRYRPFLLLILALLCVPAFAGASKVLETEPFLASTINNDRPFVGQEVLLTYRLYFNTDAPKISDEVAPSLQGVWASETKTERFIRSIPVTIQGKQFRSAVIKQFKVVPIQSGKITLSGYSMLCTIPQDNVAMDGKVLPDNRFRITAPALTISVHALPEPVPDKLSGAVGLFSLNLMADKQKLKTGEPLSLKLTLAGTGSLLTLELPSLLIHESFRRNPPERKTILSKESELTSGTIISTMVVWPQSKGVFQITATPLVVFNPETKRFSTLYAQPLTITVDSTAQQATADESAPLNTSTEKKKTITSIFIAIALLIVMSSAAIVLVRKKRLMDAKRVLAENKSEQPEASGKSARTMKEQLFTLLEEAGIKSPGGMTRTELNDAMQEIKIPDETRSELPVVLDSLDRILYSPSREKESRIPDWITTKVEALLRALKKAGSSR